MVAQHVISMKQLLFIAILVLASFGANAQSCTYCEGDTPPTLTASCTGGSGITYTWTSPSSSVSNGATASASEAGVWTWECMDANGCTATGTYTVVINTDPNISINATNACAGSSQTISVNNAPAGSTYTWTFASGTPSSSSAATPSVAWATAGTYAINVTVDDGTCQWTATTNVTIGELTGSATCN